MQVSVARAPVTSPFLLGVESSFTGRSWRDRLDAAGHAQALAMTQRHGLSEVLSDVLAGRGVGLDAVAEHLAPTIRTLLPEPYRLTDMEAAAERLARAIQSGERVAIFGDYDVDGATSSAVLASLFKAAGTPHDIYIPDRVFEGYGPNADAIRALAAAGAKLLVTVDCGTTSHAALAEARALGMDVVVLDHHQTADTLPDVSALVNPKRQDDVSGHDYLAAVGVVFLAVVATNRLLRQRGFWNVDRPEPDLLALLDLVALGTVADVVPLVGVNRAFVLKGLAAFGQRRRVGLRALADAARLKGAPTPYHLGFLIGPRINAGGRIGRANLGALLLTCDDEIEARALAEQLDRLNTERQTVERATLAEAEAGLVADNASVVATGQGWHPGVVGLVAARLKERTGKPAFAIALDAGGVGTGSGRSIPGVDLGGAVREAVAAGLLVKGGGHAMAAGVTVPPGGVPAFAAFLEQRLAVSVNTARREDVLKFDGLLAAGALQPALCHEIARAGPFGSGNPEPIFGLPGHVLSSVTEVAGGHMRLRLRAADGAVASAIAFRAADQPLGVRLKAAKGQAIHLAGALQLDEWGGRTTVSLRVLDAASAA
jgi:single-stranded-DNA-specific exonuclease